MLGFGVTFSPANFHNAAVAAAAAAVSAGHF
jgi:hypothetical protein